MNRSAAYAVVAVAPILCAATVATGHFYGRYKDGVYTAPGKLFRMTSPFPDDAIVSDGREPENNNAGAVSFIDQTGRMLGVLYMENKGPTAIPPGGEETRRLSDWFRDVGFPRFFKVSVPDARVLREDAGKLDGQPAWIAVAHVPKASPLGVQVRGNPEIQRGDSWRGMAVVARGRHYYLLQTELRVEKLVAPD